MFNIKSVDLFLKLLTSTRKKCAHYLALPLQKENSYSLRNDVHSLRFRVLANIRFHTFINIQQVYIVKCHSSR